MNAKTRNDGFRAAFFHGVSINQLCSQNPDQPDPDSSRQHPFSTLRVLTPEDKLGNVINALLGLVDGPPLPGRLQQIRSAAHQVEEYWRQYQEWLNGDDSHIESVDDDCPF